MITYPRTDRAPCRRTTFPTVRQTLANLHGDLAPHAQKVLDEGWVRPNKRIFNNAQVSDHFAIIPTTHEAEAPRRDGGEDLRHDRAPLRRGVLSRRRSSTSPPASAPWPATTSRPRARCSPSRAGSPSTARRTVDDGSPDCEGPAGAGPGRRPAAAGPDRLDATLHAETTKPPPRYTEATLLSAMEGAGKLVDDEELAEAMKERGLGTPGHPRRHDRRPHQPEVHRARSSASSCPTAKAEQLLQFLAAVKAEGLTKPGHDRRMGVQAAPDRARQVLPRGVHAGDRRRRPGASSSA